jgi:hypothetical protein
LPTIEKSSRQHALFGGLASTEPHWIRASDLSEYLYCRRAWWYRLQGAESANARGLALGTRQHVRHGRGLRLVAWQRRLAMALIVAAVVLLLLELA